MKLVFFHLSEHQTLHVSMQLHTSATLTAFKTGDKGKAGYEEATSWQVQS